MLSTKNHGLNNSDGPTFFFCADSLDCGVTMERGKNKRDGSDNGLIFSNLMHGVAAGIYGYPPHQGYTQAQSYLLLPEAYPPPPWTYPLSSAYPPQPVGYPSGGYPPAVYSDSYVHQGIKLDSFIYY